LEASAWYTVYYFSYQWLYSRFRCKYAAFWAFAWYNWVYISSASMLPIWASAWCTREDSLFNVYCV